MLLNKIMFVIKKELFYGYLKLTHRNIVFGKQIYLDRYLQLHKTGRIVLGNRTKVRSWVVLNPYGGYIEIGENCSINSFVHISGNGGVKIGNNVLIATQCVIISANHNFDNMDMPIYEQGESRKKIIIEDNCWLGAGVKVLAGVTIGTGSVIGAGAVVTRDIPPYSVCVGIPAKPIKSRVMGPTYEK